MKEAIERYLAEFSDTLAIDLPPDQREVIVRLLREELLDFLTVVGDIDRSQLAPDHIARYAIVLDERETPAVYRQVKFEQLRDFCAWLVRSKLLKRNPVPTSLCGSWWTRTRSHRQLLGLMALRTVSGAIKLGILVSALAAALFAYVWLQLDNHRHLTLKWLFVSGYATLYVLIAISFFGALYIVGHFVKKYW